MLGSGLPLEQVPSTFSCHMFFISRNVPGLVVFFKKLAHPPFSRELDQKSHVQYKHKGFNKLQPNPGSFTGSPWEISATSPWLVVSEIAKLSKHKLVVANLPNAVELPRHEELRDFRMAFRKSVSKEKFDPRSLTARP